MSINEFSLFSRDYQSQQEMQMRSKYNTLTPAEAKKINTCLNLNARQPVRTASVKNKPRPPPLVVTNLDECDGLSLSRGYSTEAPAASRSRNVNLGSASSTNRRHSVNYGRSNTLNCRMYVCPTTNGNRYPGYSNRSSSPNNSVSNLSYKSSIEVVNNANAYNSSRLTESVDLGNPEQLARIYENIRSAKIEDKQLKAQRNKLSDESFSSARSQISLDLDETTPTKQRMGSRTSLSSATYKVFQAPYANFKRFFKNIPRPFSSFDDAKTSNNDTCPANSNCALESLEQSISRLCLDRSISPPVCPPPPNELKSMSYMENSGTYSNYDEFTRSRNEKINNFSTSGLTRKQDAHNFQNNSSNNNCYSVALSNQDSDEWQLTSLPVFFERNLSTVPEERQTKILNNDRDTSHLTNATSGAYFGTTNPVKPPISFGNEPIQNQLDQQMVNCNTSLKVQTTDSPPQSLASSTQTVDSVLDYHRKTATTYKFSFAQPLKSHDQVDCPKNTGLPPRMPLTPASDNKNPDSSSGNSSTNSSQFNGSTECDRSVEKIAVAGERLEYDAENDADITILSDVSTIQGDSIKMVYENKCAEFERTIVSLKNKLINKEKELTDLQLTQLQNEWHIDRLKKENAQLKSMVLKSNNNQQIRHNL